MGASLTQTTWTRFFFSLLLFLQPHFLKGTSLLMDLLLPMDHNQDRMAPHPQNMTLLLPHTNLPQLSTSLPLSTRRRKRPMLLNPTSTSTEYRMTTPTQPLQSPSPRTRLAL